jgi:hypothetical protein
LSPPTLAAMLLYLTITLSFMSSLFLEASGKCVDWVAGGARFFHQMNTEGRFKGAQLRGTHAVDHEWDVKKAASFRWRL